MVAEPQLKVGAHVLVQLGSELVTDVEQAILECVKNSYDADAPGCIIEIDTAEKSTRTETGPASRLREFNRPFDTVQVTLCDSSGKELENGLSIPDNKLIQRRLAYTGRISIEDRGEGLTPAQLQSSWLVISQSSKRSNGGDKKQKTKAGRTPLGDKGLGRLGSMKLGDILLIETATSSHEPLSSVQFRWTDCESARTVDEIPVYVAQKKNDEAFKGTRVSVLGLRDLADWKRKDRIFDLTRSLAKLISPFEATSTFPVRVSLDNVEQSLVTITDEVLKQAIAEFQFRWEKGEDGLPCLTAEARFRKRLFTSKRTRKLEERTQLIFESDQGKAFAEHLPTDRRLSAYDRRDVSLFGPWFVELKRTFAWANIMPSGGATIEDPGPFHGAFYFFHLDNLEEQDGSAAAGIAIDKNLIKSMSGISVLRDGFRVRSQGDWLDLSAGMTSGSTYNMRVDNTVGYFALTGEQNYRLVEKSDREGFVEDAAYRGFLQIAVACRNFANDALVSARRALDEYAKTARVPKDASVAKTPEGSLQVVEDNLRSAHEARRAADDLAGELQKEIDKIESGEIDSGKLTGRALQIATSAIRAIDQVKSKLTTSKFPEFDLIRLRQELEDRNERALMLLESAAVGLSARGLAHELRTHLTEIRKRTTSLEKAIKRTDRDAQNSIVDLRAIRGSCNAIVSAASLIDPMLPRTRAVKESIDLRDLIEEYIKTRQASLDGAGIRTSITGAARTVRANRARLIQVIDNLVRNSIYWLRRGEAIGETDRAKEIKIQLTEFGFIVADTGPGVDVRYEETLFDMFVTAKPERDSGQGLGLFIIQQLLQLDACDVVLLDDRNEDGRRYKFAVNLGPLVKV
ncbi:sensor histidine kinase [Bradyrhizobium lupini]|uniref:sensor histidine kinase n=1 Tax=Rhizobium lupini TaxID=136996 RepID=UPI0034C5E207